jgi:hypothetical protein
MISTAGLSMTPTIRRSREGAQSATTRDHPAAMFGVLLKVTDKGDYDWVECHS